MSCVRPCPPNLFSPPFSEPYPPPPPLPTHPRSARRAVRRVPIPRDPYAHVESVLVRSGLIPHVSPHTAAVYAALPASERNTHQNEARRMLRDTMHPVRQERHPHQVRRAGRQKAHAMECDSSMQRNGDGGGMRGAMVEAVDGGR